MEFDYISEDIKITEEQLKVHVKKPNIKSWIFI